jgi:hypothetical protein
MVEDGDSSVGSSLDRSCSCTGSSRTLSNSLKRPPAARHVGGGTHRCAAKAAAKSRLAAVVAILELQKQGQKQRIEVSIL